MTQTQPQPRRSLSRGPKQILWRQFVSGTVIALTAVATLIAVGALVMVLGYLLVKGFGSLNLAIITRGPVPSGEAGGGLRNGLIGTLILLGLSSLIGIPIGILGGLYQIEAKGRFAWWVRFFTDVLNSIPSIVIGIFAYVVVVLPFGGFSALAGGFALGILMIPTIMRTTEEILRLVPSSLREASLGLGATRWRTMLSVILPSARSGVITGIMLAVARVAGETAPLLFTAFGNTGFSTRLNQPIDALPINIFNDAMAPDSIDNKLALAGAILLICLIFALSLVARFALRNNVQEQS